jgi:hypothetical protein
MGPFARAVRKRSSLNIESGELALGGLADLMARL